MSAMMIYLPGIADVEAFVNIMSRFPFEAQLTVGSYTVDAKSIMGIFTLDREQPIRMEVGTAEPEALERLSTAISRFLYHPVR